MSIQTYNLQFHMAQAETSQDVQNRYLLYQQVQSGVLAEQEKDHAVRARQQVPPADQPEGKQVEPDAEGRNPGAFRRRRRSEDQEQQSLPRDGGASGGGQLIDLII